MIGGKDMTRKLIMPMAGNGKRFFSAGFTNPKPFIDVNGKPMFVRTVESIGLEFDEMIFIVRKQHGIAELIPDWYPDAKVIELDGETEGAAITVMKAEKHMSDDDSVFVCNCDQFFEWDSSTFSKIEDCDGGILLFRDKTRDPKWSFAKYTQKTGVITRVAEKDPISDWATAGLYYWREWSTFVSSVQSMVDDDDRTNGEYYLCPVFNHTLRQKKSVCGVPITRMHGVGTPEDLGLWLANNPNS